MKYKVKIHDRSFDVEIDDINEQPILARVDGKTYQVWISEDNELVLKPKKEPEISRSTSLDKKQVEGKNHQPTTPQQNKRTINSPIPGTIVSIEVKPGEEVVSGQPLCVIEAMKMKNTIRSPRAGIVQFVPIQIGQHVRHNEILVEFSD